MLDSMSGMKDKCNGQGEVVVRRSGGKNCDVEREKSHVISTVNTNRVFLLADGGQGVQYVRRRA